MPSNEVSFSTRARRDLFEIFETLSSDADPKTAARLVDRIEDRCRSLIRYPDRCLAVPTRSRRQLRRVIEAPYVIIYETRPEIVLIVTVLHGARNLQMVLDALGSSGEQD